MLIHVSDHKGTFSVAAVHAAAEDMRLLLSWQLQFDGLLGGGHEQVGVRAVVALNNVLLHVFDGPSPISSKSAETYTTSIPRKSMRCELSKEIPNGMCVIYHLVSPWRAHKSSISGDMKVELNSAFGKDFSVFPQIRFDFCRIKFGVGVLGRFQE